jgi:hypothetical protein
LTTTHLIGEADWPTVEPDFQADGALRDVYVQHTTLADWQRFVEYVRQHHQPVRFMIDGSSQQLPASVEHICELRRHSTPLLQFEVGPVTLDCHFFCDEEIELSFWPEDIRSSDDFGQVLGFLRTLSGVLAKKILATPENAVELPILTCSPTTSMVEYHPSPDEPTV